MGNEGRSRTLVTTVVVLLGAGLVWLFRPVGPVSILAPLHANRELLRAWVNNSGHSESVVIKDSISQDDLPDILIIAADDWSPKAFECIGVGDPVQGGDYYAITMVSASPKKAVAARTVIAELQQEVLEQLVPVTSDIDASESTNIRFPQCPESSLHCQCEDPECPPNPETRCTG